MKILIFGSSGFLGKKLIELLSKKKNLIIFRALRNKKNIDNKN